MDARPHSTGYGHSDSSVNLFPAFCMTLGYHIRYLTSPAAHPQVMNSQERRQEGPCGRPSVGTYGVTQSSSCQNRPKNPRIPLWRSARSSPASANTLWTHALIQQVMDARPHSSANLFPAFCMTLRYHIRYLTSPAGRHRLPHSSQTVFRKGPYRGTSLIRKRPPPWDYRRALGIGLL